MMNKKFSWLICLFCISYSYGQEFTYEAVIAPINENGYYKIALSPELLGKLRSNQSDIRIYSSDGKEQPYLMSSEMAVSSTSLFREYKIIEKNYEEDAISFLIFQNPEKRAIDNVSFIVKNTEVKKRARLSGSDDQENWYVIKDNYLLHAMHNMDSTLELKILNFPLSDYAFFKLEINDNWKLPINILKVGYYDTQKTKGMLTEFDFPVAQQKDSSKTSYVKLMLPESKFLEKLKIQVSGSEYYSRHANILVRRERLNSKKRQEIYYESIGTFELNSNSRNEIEIIGQSANELYMEIDNKDNQPLTVEKVTGSFLNKYIIAKLDPTKSYIIRFGDEKIGVPDYDIKAFADRILPNARKINHGVILNLKSAEPSVEKQASIFDNTYFIWSIIAVVGLLLGFISFKMIREMGNRS